MISRSETIGALAAALSKAQSEFDHAKKDVNNTFFKSKYADLAGCIDAARAQLSANGLSVSQYTDLDETGRMLLFTILMHSSGEWISGKYPISPVKNDPQGIGSAITYARRYSFCAITGIASDDDDGNAASGKSNESGKYSEQTMKLVIDYSRQIDNASDLQNLQNIWTVIPKEYQNLLLVNKDDKKKILSKPEAEAA